MPKKGEAWVLASAYREDCKTVAEFMRLKVRPPLARATIGDATSATIEGVFLRAQGWLATFERLQEPSDFQAAISGARALFEIAVDLVLLHHDRANMPVRKMIVWERSAKLKAAERTKRFYEELKVPIPDEHQERVDFIAREGAAVRAERAAMWPTQPHGPPRWTGRTLEQDAVEADRLAPYQMREYHDTRFAELCWGTHGSGLASIRYVDEAAFPALYAIAAADAADFGVLAAQLSLYYFDAYAPLSADFERLANERIHWRERAYSEASQERDE